MSSKALSKERETSDFFPMWIYFTRSRTRWVVGGTGWCKPSQGSEVCYPEYFFLSSIIPVALQRNFLVSSSRSGSPSSLVARHLNMSTVVFVLVLNWSHTVHSRCALEVNRLAAWSRRGRRGRTLLENALRRTRVRVWIHWNRLLAAKLSRRSIGWAEGRRRDRCPWHWTWWPQGQSWASGSCRSRDAERQLWLGWACGVHFCCFVSTWNLIEMVKIQASRGLWLRMIHQGDSDKYCSMK